MSRVVMTIGAVLAFFGVVFGIAFMTEGTDVALARVFNPAREEVRRQTFEHSRAYREGMAQELQAMQMEWIRAEPAQKNALASVILHRTAGVELDWLPQDLQQFVTKLRTEQGMH